MSEKHPDYICPSCMWQGDEPNRRIVPYCGVVKFCPTCDDEVMDRKEYDQNEGDNAREDELEERKIDYAD